MPLPFLTVVMNEGIGVIPYLSIWVRLVPCLIVTGLLKFYFSGARNQADRLMRSKVIMITGGTSGIGAAIARDLGERGAQIILLTSQPPSDPFVADYIDDLRSSTNNNLIYAEQVDLSSLHSIRLFATKWVDNAPPRRLDMIILCAATMTPRFGRKNAEGKPLVTFEGLEPCWGVNYLANFHLLSILSPALRAQPPDRDVRIIMATCPAYLGGEVKGMRDSKSPLPQGREYSTSKLALMTFANAFQKHLDAYVRPDKQPNNARVIMVDPGTCRTPGTRRWLSLGSLPGLIVYLLLWPVWWLVLKSSDGGAQSFLTAAMDASLGGGLVGGESMGAEGKLGGEAYIRGGEEAKLIRECRVVPIARPEVRDDKVAKELWSFSEKQIVALEKESAVKRALAKKEAEAKAKQEEKKEGATTGKEARAPGSRRSRKS